MKQIAETWEIYLNRKTNRNTSHERHSNDTMIRWDMGNRERVMKFREKRLTEGHRDARRAMAEPSSSSSLWRFTPPVHPIPLSAARCCGCSSPTGTPAAVLGSCPLDSGELNHSGSHASDTASNKGHRRRRGHLTEHVPHRVMLFVRLCSRGTALAGTT